MQNRYLDILELKPGASRQEVKAAYRKLSKRYHPDVNHSRDAAEKFVAINEAYRFLSQVGPFPHQEKVAYAYDPFAAEYEQRRRKAYEYARQKAREEQARQDHILATTLRYFNYAALAFGFFNFLLAIDYFLPPREFEQRIIQIQEVGYTVRGSTYHDEDIKFENFRLRVHLMDARSFSDYQHAVVVATPLLRVPLEARIALPEKTITLHQRYSVIRVFGYMIPAIFVILILYFFLLKNPDRRLGMAVLLSFLIFLQLFLYLRF
jgi:hypothetical protein